MKSSYKRTGKKKTGTTWGKTSAGKGKKRFWLIGLLVLLLAMGSCSSCMGGADREEASASDSNQNPGTQTSPGAAAEEEPPVQNPSEDGNTNQEDQAAREEVDSALPNEADSVGKDEVEPSGESELSVTMVDVGQGLCILLESDGEYMLYDGGGRETSSAVVTWLRQLGITELKYMVASHYDEDHIAGLVGALNTVKVDLAITPDYEADTYIYQSFREQLEASETEEIHPTANDTFLLGSATVSVLSAGKYNMLNDNDSSIVMRVTSGDFAVMLTGDAEETVERELAESGAELKSTLYVVGHHGSASSTTEEFLQAMDPECAMISVGSDNAYGHPTEQTMTRLQETGVKMFRSDLQGTVTVVYDGEKWTSDAEPSQDWTAGTIPSREPGTENGSGLETEITYITNEHTMKFHRTTCKSLDRMSDKNRGEKTETREELIRQGYSPCGNCNP